MSIISKLLRDYSQTRVSYELVGKDSSKEVTKILNQLATEFAKKHNCYKVFLETGSNKESTLNFYKNNGFAIDAKHSCLKRL